MNLDTLKQLDKKYAQVIANELLKRIETDECLLYKLVETSKTLKGCIAFIKSEAKKQSEENCAVMLDEDVFQLAQHYFLEDSINFEPKTKTEEKNVSKKNTTEDKKLEEVKPTKKAAVKKKFEKQVTIFDL